MTNKEKIEELLKNYRKIKHKAKILIITECPEYSLPAIDYSSTGKGESNEIYSKVEDFVVEKDEEESEVRDLIRARDIIKAGIDSLTVEQKRIVGYLYFEGKTQLEAGERVGCSERTIKTRKTEILQGLEDVGMFKAYEYWEGENERN